MSLRIIDILSSSAECEAIEAIAHNHQAIEITRLKSETDGQSVTRILFESGGEQGLLDDLQHLLEQDEKWRLTILPVETTIPLSEDQKQVRASLKKSLSREELYDDLKAGSQLDGTYLIFVALSTIVAALGLIQNNVAVIIGAMVIAPLLAPNLAFSYGVAMGDRGLILQSFQTLVVGTLLGFVMSVGIGLFIPVHPEQAGELVARTVIDFGAPVLALASGAAAVLSITGGTASALVGVMVAVALLPPIAAAGIFAGQGQWALMFQAGLLLLVNIVCINLSAQTVLYLKGIKPRRWLEKRSASQSVKMTLSVWGVLLGILIVLIAVLSRSAV